MLPAGWTCAKFGDVVRNVNENSRDLEGDGIDRVVGLDHLDPGSLRLLRWDNLIDLPDGTTFTRKFKPGHVLFGKRRAYQRKVAVPDFDGVCSGDILVFEPADERMLAEFLPYLVQSDGFLDHALGTSAGSLSPRTKWAELAKYDFALPPIDEQRQVATILNAAQNVVSQCEKVETSGLVNALFSQKFEDGQLTIDSICQVNPELIRDRSFISWPAKYIDISAVSFENGIDLGAVQSVDAESAPSRAQRIVRAGDILLSTVRPTLRAMAIVPEELEGALASTGFVVLRPLSKADQYFVWGLIRSSRFTSSMISCAVGTNYPAHKASDLARFSFAGGGSERRKVIAETVKRCARFDVSARVALTSGRSQLISLRSKLIDRTSNV